MSATLKEQVSESGRVKIDKKIVSCEIAKAPGKGVSSTTEAADKAASAESAPVPQVLHERLRRPEALHGTTYKVKAAYSEHALYCTINDIVLNAGTAHELRRPFEIFINSKNMEHFQWVVSLTRTLSAIFRNGGEIAFLVEELRCVHDPRGGWWDKGRYIPSIPAAIGDILARHLAGLGLYEDDRPAHAVTVRTDDAHKPRGATCPKCQQPQLVRLDGCETCLSCAYSHCG